MHKRGWMYGALTGLFLGCSLYAEAQHLHLSQLYAAPLNLNPAFAGLQAKASATVQYRNQWPKLPNAYQTIQAQGDYRFKETNNGAGLLLYQDQAGDGALSRFEATASYAYHAKLTRTLSASAGIGAGAGYQKANFNKFLFGDQISDNGHVSGNTSEIAGNYNSKTYFTLNAGGIVFDHNFWLSGAGFHLNRPDVSFSGNATDPLASAFVFTGGYRFFFEEEFEDEGYSEISIAPVAYYYRQGRLEQFNLGAYGTYRPLQAGVLYKGISLFGITNYSQAVALLVGASVGSFNACYSYDIPVSGIGRSAGGAHELSLVFQQIDYNKIARKRVRDKKYRPVSCPVF